MERKERAFLVRYKKGAKELRERKTNTPFCSLGIDQRQLRELIGRRHGLLRVIRKKRRRLPIERRHRAVPPIVPLPFLRAAVTSGHSARLESQAIEERGAHRETAEMGPGYRPTRNRRLIRHPGLRGKPPAHGACVAAGYVVVGERGEVDVGDAEAGIGVEENVVGEAEEGPGVSLPVSAAGGAPVASIARVHGSSKSIRTACGPVSSHMRTQAPGK